MKAITAVSAVILLLACSPGVVVVPPDVPVVTYPPPVVEAGPADGSSEMAPNEEDEPPLPCNDNPHCLSATPW